MLRSSELSPYREDSIEKISVIDLKYLDNLNNTRKTQGSTNIYESTQLGMRAGTAMQSLDDRFTCLQDNSTPFDTRGGTVMSSIDDNPASRILNTTPQNKKR